jgi:hypothetical protein
LARGCLPKRKAYCLGTELKSEAELDILADSSGQDRTRSCPKSPAYSSRYQKIVFVKIARRMRSDDIASGSIDESKNDSKVKTMNINQSIT